jgi:hypothetical protein
VVTLPTYSFSGIPSARSDAMAASRAVRVNEFGGQGRVITILSGLVMSCANLPNTDADRASLQSVLGITRLPAGILYFRFFIGNPCLVEGRSGAITSVVSTPESPIRSWLVPPVLAPSDRTGSGKSESRLCWDSPNRTLAERDRTRPERNIRKSRPSAARWPSRGT